MSSKTERIACAAAGITAGAIVGGPIGAVAGAATAAAVDYTIQKLEKRGQKKK